MQSGKGTNETTLQLISLEAQTGQPEQAMKDLTAAVAKKPNDAQLVSQLVTALTARGRSRRCVGGRRQSGRRSGATHIVAGAAR